MTTIAMTSGDWIGTAASWMLTYLIHSTILILAVWLLVRGIKPIAARIRPSAENLAWKLALVGAFVTATAQLAAGVEPALGALELETRAELSEVAASPAAAAPATIRVAPGPRSAVVVDESEAMMLGVQPPPAPTPAAAEPAPAPVWPKLLLVVWAIGAGLMLVRLLLAARTLRQRLRDRGPVLEDPVLESFLTLCRDAEIERTIKLTQSARIASPIALWRREIVVPERAVVELSPAAMRSVLAHELAHLERRDPYWLVFAAVIEALCLFQPLNWLARRGMQESAELLCDDWAIARTGDGVVFAKSLHEVASWEQANRSSLLLAGMVSGERPLVRRVRRALDGDPNRFESDTSPRPARALVGLGSLAALILVAPGAVDASPPQAGDAAKPARPQVEAQAQVRAEDARAQEATARAAAAAAKAEAAQREADRLAAEARAAEAAARANGSGGPHLILRDGDEYLRIDENGVTLRSKDADIDIVDDGTDNPRLRMRVREGGSELDLDVDLDTLEGLGNMAMGLLGEELLGGAPVAPGAPNPPPPPGAPSAFGGVGGLDELDALGALELLGGLGGLGGLDEQALEREIAAIERELEQELLRELGDAFGGAFGGAPGRPSAPAAPPAPSPPSMPTVAPQPPVQPMPPTQPSGPLTLI